MLRTFIWSFPHPFKRQCNYKLHSCNMFHWETLLYNDAFLKVFSQEEHSLGIQCLKSRTRFCTALPSQDYKYALYAKFSQSRSQHYAFISSRQKVLKEKNQAHSAQVNRNSVQLDRNTVSTTPTEGGAPSSAFHHQHQGFRARYKKACGNLAGILLQKSSESII